MVDKSPDTWTILHPDEARASDGTTLRQRLADRTTVLEDGCHVWTGSLNGKGYASYTIDNWTRSIARVTFRLEHGFWPDNARHTCDNPPCVRPDHLIDGTISDNMLDAVYRGRDGWANRTHCKNGHELVGWNVKPELGGNGRTYRRCRACNNEKAARCNARKRAS